MLAAYRSADPLEHYPECKTSEHAFRVTAIRRHLAEFASSVRPQEQLIIIPTRLRRHRCARIELPLHPSTPTRNSPAIFGTRVSSFVIAPSLDRALALTRSVLSDAGSVDALYLTGGSSRIPLVHDRLQQIAPIATLDDPKTVVAQGALIATLTKMAGPASADCPVSPATVPLAIPASEHEDTPHRPAPPSCQL